MQLVTLISTTYLLSLGAVAASESILRYEHAATRWEEALPIGNGRIGAMIFGGAQQSVFQLNEATLYTNEPLHRLLAPKAYPALHKEVISLLNQKKFAAAEALLTLKGQGRKGAIYQPMTKLTLDFGPLDDIQNYERRLDLNQAIHTVKYRHQDNEITQESFASHPDHCIYLRISATKAESIQFSASFSSLHPITQPASSSNLEIRAVGQAPGYASPRNLHLFQPKGRCDPKNYPEIFDPTGKPLHPNKKEQILYSNEIEGRGMFFETRLRVLKCNGKITLKNGVLNVDKASEVILALGAATSFNGPDKSPSREGRDPEKILDQTFKKIETQSFEEAKNRHRNDYQALFHQCHLQLGETIEASELTTMQRLHNAAHDPAFAALVFQYGRYLLISSSRQGGQPANLQGIWNDKLMPPWDANYTLNINAQMNYWPAEVTGLSSCHEPLLRMTQEMVKNGTITAQKLYGIKRGWCAHHNTTIWRETGLSDGDCEWFPWPMGAGWLCSHLWEHYTFTGDEEFLKNQAYPTMKGAAEFFADWLQEDNNGHLVTPISISPENRFLDENGNPCAVSQGTTMDLSIIRELFNRVIIASELLNTDANFRQELIDKRKRMLPYQVGKDGRLLEWAFEATENDPLHRHISHLYALHPSDQITQETPQLFEAARKTLIKRGDEATGWSMGWKINFWARLNQGDKAHQIISNFFRPAILANGKERAGLYPNLFCAHPPFQIDGNLGYTAGVAEMLLQSHRRTPQGHSLIHLLPALPKAWANGEVNGLRARPGATINMHWRDGELTQVSVTSLNGKPFSLFYQKHLLHLQLNKGQTILLNSNLQQK